MGDLPKIYNFASNSPTEVVLVLMEYGGEKELHMNLMISSW